MAGPAYRVETARLVVRCWSPADAALLKAAVDESLDHLRPWMPWARHEPTELAVKVQLLREFRGKFDLGDDFVYGIFDRDESRVLGGSGLHVRSGPAVREIGYWIHADRIGQGLATEAAGALTRVAIEVEGIPRIEIRCDPANMASARVPEKLGFRHEATLRQVLTAPDGSPRDAMVWALLADEYPASPVAAIELSAYDAAGVGLCRRLPG
jgi:RimJ/RimL family protein N-acetyltransferase